MPNPEAFTLFTRMQRDLVSVRPDQPPDTVLCPLCLETFDRGDLEGPDPRLTIEHIVPESVGGTWTTLTCKRCNNEHGSAIDAHLVRRIRAHNTLAADARAAPLNGKFDCEGRKIGMSFRPTQREDGRTHNVIHLKGGPPELLERLSHRFRSGDVVDMKFSLSLDYIEERSRLAMIRAAYLLLFKDYGYRYILREGPSVIRRMIAGDIPLHGQEIWRIADQVATWEINRDDVEVGSVTLSFFSDDRAIGHMVVFKVAEGKLRYFSVLMPTYDQPADSVMPRLHALSDMIKGQPLTVTIRPPVVR